MQTILIVEDDPTITLGLTYMLEQQGYRALQAGTLAAVREIREQDGVPVIFLTASDEEVSIIRGLDMGAEDYVTKPFRIGELMSRIRNVLRRQSNAVAEDDRIRVGDLSIHVQEGKVFLKGELVFLTALEYRLLLTLARHRGQIMSLLWDHSGQFINDNTLSVTIRRLRQKIEHDHQDPRLIQTVRGLGYRLGGGI